jgi:hypothetical protein
LIILIDSIFRCFRHLALVEHAQEAIELISSRFHTLALFGLGCLG